MLASDAFQILDVRYHYQAAVEAGSDHGLVKAKLALDTLDAGQAK